MLVRGIWQQQVSVTRPGRAIPYQVRVRHAHLLTIEIITNVEFRTEGELGIKGPEVKNSTPVVIVEKASTVSCRLSR